MKSKSIIEPTCYELAMIACQLDPEAIKSGDKAAINAALDAAYTLLLQAEEYLRFEQPIND